MASTSACVKLRNIKRALEQHPTSNLSYIIGGRVERIRSYKAVNFIDLVDGSTQNHLQTVINRNLLNKPELGSYLLCEGKLLESRGAQQALEFKVDSVRYLGACDPLKYPLVGATSNMPAHFYRRWPHLRPRAVEFGSFLRVMSDMDYAFHKIMREMDFLRVYGPSLTSNDSEASSDLFLVERTVEANRSDSSPGQDNDKPPDNEELSDNEETSDNEDEIKALDEKRIIRKGYFKKDVFLSTSAQLHLEMLAGSLSKVYTLETAFRAESSITRRHLSKFHMFELEESNLLELEPLIDRAESLIKSVTKYISQEAENKLDFNKLVESNNNQNVLEKLANHRYIRMNYSEALEILRDKIKFEGNTKYGCDIGGFHEKALLKYCDNVPIFITDYPKQLKPFYMKCDPDDKEARCFDLIAPIGGELCGGSLREDSCDKLIKNLSNLNIPVDGGQFNWYLDLRRFGTFPHGGFGIGIERFLQTLLGMRNIRDTTPFPRWPGHCPM